MKKIALFMTLFFILTQSFAMQLSDFQQIKTVLNNGKKIRIVINFNKCLADQKNISIPVFNSFTPSILHVFDNQITTSYTSFTSNNPNYSKNYPLYESMQYTITKNNDIHLTLQFFDIKNYQAISPLFSFHCKLKHGVNIYS